MSTKILLNKVLVKVRFTNGRKGQFSFQYPCNPKIILNQPVLPKTNQFNREYAKALKKFLQNRLNQKSGEQLVIADTETTTSLTATSGCGPNYRCRECPCKNTDRDLCGSKPQKICISKNASDKDLKGACLKMSLDWATKCGSGTKCDCESTGGGGDIVF